MSKTKYETLIESWVNSHNEYADYKRTCLEFIKKVIIFGFADYLKCPQPHHVNTFNLNKKFEPGKCDGWSKSMVLRDDTFWHFGLSLTLEGKNAKRIIKLHLVLKKEDDSYIIRIEDLESPVSEKEIRIHEDEMNNIDKLNVLYNLIFEVIKNDMDNGFKEFMNRGRKSGTSIGFQSYDIEDEID